MARFPKIRTGAICIKKFADKRTFANTGRISFDNTDYMVNETRAYAAARSRIAGCRVGTCNVGERPIICLLYTSQKILAKHAGKDLVKPGDLITCRLDRVLANDITAPPAIKEFEKIGRPVFDKDRIVLVPDHFIPNKDIKSAGLAKIVRDFA